MTMREKMARGMYERDRVGIAQAKPAPPAWDEMSEARRTYWRRNADAALDAMREPTEGMIEKGAHLDVELEWLESTKAVPQVYTVMIDAAKEGA